MIEGTVHRYPSTIAWLRLAVCSLQTLAGKEGSMNRDNGGCVLGCVVAMMIWGLGGLGVLAILIHVVVLN